MSLRYVMCVRASAFGAAIFCLWILLTNKTIHERNNNNQQNPFDSILLYVYSMLWCFVPTNFSFTKFFFYSRNNNFQFSNFSQVTRIRIHNVSLFTRSVCVCVVCLGDIYVGVRISHKINVQRKIRAVNIHKITDQTNRTKHMGTYTRRQRDKNCVFEFFLNCIKNYFLLFYAKCVAISEQQQFHANIQSNGMKRNVMAWNALVHARTWTV